jgi:hypothetical protein
VKSEEASAERSETKLDGMWMDSIDWEGKAEFKQKAGSDLGTRLYSGKKRMFKGHKWERMKEGRDIKRRILMRDMARRVRNYKAVRWTFVSRSSLFTLLFAVLPETKTKSSQTFKLCKSSKITILDLALSVVQPRLHISIYFESQ